MKTGSAASRSHSRFALNAFTCRFVPNASPLMRSPQWRRNKSSETGCFARAPRPFAIRTEPRCVHTTRDTGAYDPAGIGRQCDSLRAKTINCGSPRGARNAQQHRAMAPSRFLLRGECTYVIPDATPTAQH